MPACDLLDDDDPILVERGSSSGRARVVVARGRGADRLLDDVDADAVLLEPGVWNVGYQDPFSFSRQFRAVHGCRPRAYRELDTADEPSRDGR